jgi:hypothetical protein
MSSGCANRRVWHKDEEMLLKSWGEMCNAYSWMHDKAGQWTGVASFAGIVVPTMLANTTALALSFIAFSYEAEEVYHTKIINVTAGVVNAVAIGLTLLDRTMRLPEAREKHSECSALFAKIGRMIEAELSIPKRRRLMDGYDFLRMVGFDVDRILNMKVRIPDWIVQAFKKKFARKKFFKPGELREIYISTVSNTPQTPDTPEESIAAPPPPPSERSSPDSVDRINVVNMRKSLDSLMRREEMRVQQLMNEHPDVLNSEFYI